jgi:hypothetical protein
VCVCVCVWINVAIPTGRVRRVARCQPKAAHTDIMSDTDAVFQSAIGPYVVVAVAGLVTHASAAVLKFPLVMASNAATCAGSARSSARPARRCDRHARAQLHRKRHEVWQRSSTRCNAGCAAPSVVQRRAPTKLQHCWMHVGSLAHRKGLVA